MSEFKLTDLTQLDDVTYDEVDKLLQLYEDTRAIVEYRLRKLGSLEDAEPYEQYDAVLSELKQSKDVQRRRAIARQVREYYSEGRHGN